MQSAIFINGDMHIVEMGPLESERMIKERVAFHKQEKKGHFVKEQLDKMINKFSTRGTKPFYDDYMEEEEETGTSEDIPTYSMPTRAADPFEIGGTMYFPPATSSGELENMTEDQFGEEMECCDDMEAGPFHQDEYSDSSEDDLDYYPHFSAGPQHLPGPFYESQKKIKGTTYFNGYNKAMLSEYHSSEEDGYSTGSNRYSSSSSEDEDYHRDLHPYSTYSTTPSGLTEMRGTTYFPLPSPNPPIPSLLNYVPPPHSMYQSPLPRPLLPPMGVYRPTPLMNIPTRRFY